MANIIIPAAHKVGDTVYYLRGGRINRDVVKAIVIGEFTIDCRNHCAPSPKYKLENDTYTFWESDLHATPQGIIDSLQEQVKQYNPKRTRRSA